MGFAGSDIIEFVVGGEEGIRLSDASEGNWTDFEDRDDRSLFEEDRLQIIIRLHVRLPASTHHGSDQLILLIAHRMFALALKGETRFNFII
jgi:hypothetical protein